MFRPITVSGLNGETNLLLRQAIGNEKALSRQTRRRTGNSLTSRGIHGKAKARSEAYGRRPRAQIRTAQRQQEVGVKPV